MKFNLKVQVGLLVVQIGSLVLAAFGVAPSVFLPVGIVPGPAIYYLVAQHD